MEQEKVEQVSDFEDLEAYGSEEEQQEMSVEEVKEGVHNEVMAIETAEVETEKEDHEQTDHISEEEPSEVAQNEQNNRKPHDSQDFDAPIVTRPNMFIETLNEEEDISDEIKSPREAHTIDDKFTSVSPGLKSQTPRNNSYAIEVSIAAQKIKSISSPEEAQNLFKPLPDNEPSNISASEPSTSTNLKEGSCMPTYDNLA